MSDSKYDLLSRKAEIEAGNADEIAAQKKAGKMTARERLAMLFDEGTFVEIGALVGGEMGESVVAGYGLVEDRPVYAYANDFTVNYGAVSTLHAKKILRVAALAQKTGAPLVSVFDSYGARIDEGIAAANAYSQIIKAHTNLSGVVPQVAIVAGPCIGAAAMAASASDFVIMTDEVSSLLARGPQVMGAIGETTKDASEYAGAQAAAKAGVCAYAAKNEGEAIAYARAILSHLPSNNIEDAPAYDGEDLNRAIATEGDLASVCVQMSDNAAALELFAGYGEGVNTFLGKIGGTCAGIIALKGAIAPCGAAKAAKFAGICDSYNIPLVFVVDSCGFKVESIEDNFAAIKSGAKLAFAIGEASVAKVCVVTGKAVGSVYSLLCGGSADMVYAWPKAVLGAMDSDAAARILYGKEVAAGMSMAEAVEKYETEVASPYEAASAGAVDEVISPETTRQYVIAALEMLFSKRESVTAKKHDNRPV